MRDVRVVDEQPLVAERLAARPADAGDPLGRGLRQHDVARDGHDGAPQVAQAREPGVGREHHRVGLDRAAGRLDQRGPVAPQRQHRRVLVDAHAGLERGSAQSARVERGLHGGPVRKEHAGERERTPGAPPDLVAGQLLRPLGPAGLRERRERLAPLPDLRLAGRHRDVPRLAVAGDPPALVELADLADRPRRRLREHQRVPLAEALDELGQLVPPGGREAAVAARGAAAADVLLEHDDAGVGRAPADLERRPEPGVAAADDAHVGTRRRVERWAGAPRIALEHLLQPPAPRPARHGCARVSDFAGTPACRP